MQIERKEIGTWSIATGSEKFVSSEIIKSLEDFLTNDWRNSLLKIVEKPWHGAVHYKVPSPIIRIDLSPLISSDSVKKSIYEIETRPAGLGVTMSLLPEKIKLWQEALSNCHGIIKGHDSVIQDDLVFANLVGLLYFNEGEELNGLDRSKLYWVRSDKLPLEDISLVPISDDGNKQYLVDLEMAKIVDKNAIDWDIPFAIKPLKGARCRAVEIYLPNSIRKNFTQGNSTKSRVIRTLTENDETFIIQPFIPPKEEVINENVGYKMWRMNFGWINNQYQFIGGLWLWRQNIRSHGSNDTICGPLR